MITDPTPPPAQVYRPEPVEAEAGMKDLLIDALEKLLDFAALPQRYVREDGTFDLTSAMRDWRRLRNEARVVLLAAMEKPK